MRPAGQTDQDQELLRFQSNRIDIDICFFLHFSFIEWMNGFWSFCSDCRSMSAIKNIGGAGNASYDCGIIFRNGGFLSVKLHLSVFGEFILA